MHKCVNVLAVLFLEQRRKEGRKGEREGGITRGRKGCTNEVKIVIVFSV